MSRDPGRGRRPRVLGHPLTLDPADASADFCYLVTTGRKTGRPHEIEIWFAMPDDGAAAYLLSGGRDRSDWVRNVVADPHATVRFGSRRASPKRALARVVTDGDEDALARRLLLDKYGPRYSGDLTEWGRTALPVALELLEGDGR